MSEEPERSPAGQAESESVDLDEPQREERRAERGGPRPNLDERHERIQTTRKPMGPPLGEPDEDEALDDTLERGREAEQPVDPDEPRD